MTIDRPSASTVSLLGVLVGLFALPLGAELPPITDAERALVAVPGDPSASAVVLFERSSHHLEPHGKESASSVTIERRIKILREEGKEDWSEIVLNHSDFVRLKEVAARTIRADGSVLELSENDIFRREVSAEESRYLTTAVFPGVEVGAILDLQVEMRYESILQQTRWLFQDRIPTLYSEVQYTVPDYIGFRHWARADPERLQMSVEQVPGGRRLRAVMENLPAVPDEEMSFPLADLASQFMLLPTEYLVGATPIDLLTSWESVCDLYDDLVYDEFYRKKGSSRSLAKKITAEATKAEERAAVLFEWVRDSIRRDPGTGVSVGVNSTAGRVLDDRRGSATEQALLLAEMLDAVKIDADIVWVAERENGRIDTNTPNPGWFDRAILRIHLGGGEVWADPADRRLGLGHLPPGLEGTAALVFHTRRPELVDLPTTEFTDHLKRSRLELAVDDEGALAGNGVIELTGHHAWSLMTRSQEAPERWQEYLEKRLPGFVVAAVEVDEDPARRRVDVRWSLEQKDEDVLGDEAVIDPNRPWEPMTQIFRSTQRRTPALLAYVDREESEVVVTWPEAWEVDALPAAADFATPVGAYVASTEVDAENRRVRRTRRLDMVQRELTNSAELGAMKEMLATAERVDAQQLVLVRR